MNPTWQLGFYFMLKGFHALTLQWPASSFPCCLLIWCSPIFYQGFRWLRGKKSACQWRMHKRRGFDPWVKKIAWRRKWKPTPIFLPWRHRIGPVWARAHTHASIASAFLSGPLTYTSCVLVLSIPLMVPPLFSFDRQAILIDWLI